MRECSVCKKPMDSGYCIGDGEDYRCSDECLHTDITPEAWELMYENGEGHYTEWEE